MESMTIACTRCGATQDGDIISPPLAFGFKHNAKCGHGVGPLAVMPSARKSEKNIAERHADRANEEVVKEINKEVEKEESAEKPKSKREKLRVFGKKE